MFENNSKRNINMGNTEGKKIATKKAKKTNTNSNN